MTNTFPAKEFGERLTQLRENNGLTQTQLGVKVGRTASTISLYEKGLRTPNATFLYNISELFNVSVDYLLGREGITLPSPADTADNSKPLKPYVNREECSDVLCLFAFFTHIENMIEAWAGRGNLTGKELALLRAAADNTFNAAEEIMRRLDAPSVQKIRRSIHTWEVKLIPTDTAQEFMKRVQAEINEPGVFCPTETMNGLAEMAIEGCCHPCVQHPEARGVCPFRAILMELEIPMYNEYPAEGICPYDIGPKDGDVTDNE